MKHEEKAIKAITDARRQVLEVVSKGTPDVQKLVDLGEKMQQVLAPIRAVFESTPQLQAAGPTQKLMDELRDTSDKVMYSRRTMIDLSADYNVRLVTFPSNVVANMFGFKPEKGLETPMSGEHLSVSGEEMKSPKVKLN